MKALRVSLIAAVALILATSASAETHGWGLGAGAFNGDFGVQLRKDIGLGGDISHITAQGSVFFPGKTSFRLDADYHFSFLFGKGSRFYPLGGVDFTFNSNTAKFGVNAGGGLNFMLTKKLAAFGEGKYVFGDWDGWTFVGGIYF
jgi:hypothetical protein